MRGDAARRRAQLPRPGGRARGGPGLRGRSGARLGDAGARCDAGADPRRRRGHAAAAADLDASRSRSSRSSTGRSSPSCSTGCAATASTTSIMSCGFLAVGRAQRARRRRARYGIRLRYVEEPQPLGTGGALKFAEELLDERFLMLNGDVLTDLDLTAQIAQHEAHRRARTLALIAGRGPVAPTGWCRTHRRRRGHASSSRSRRRDQIDTTTISAGAYVLERSVLELLAPGEPRLDRARRVPAARRRRPLRLRRRGLLARHRDARALPAGHVRHPRGRRSRTAVGERDGRRLPRRRPTTSRTRAGSSRRRSSRPAAGSARTRRIGGRVVLEARRHGRRGHDDRARRRPARAPRSARTARCAAASSAPARRSATARTSRACAVLGEGVTRRRRQRHHQRRAHVPRRDLPDGGDPVLMSATGARRAAGRRRRPHGPARRDRSTCPSTCATRSGASTPPPSRRVDAAGGLIVAGHGRLGRRRRAGRARARRRGWRARSRSRAATTLPAWIGARDAGAVRELLRRHRGDARHLRRGRRAGAPRLVATTGGALAERAREDGVPVIPLPGGFQPRAAVGYSLVAALEAAALCGAAPSLRDEIERRRRAAPRTSRPSGARTAPRTATPRSSRARCTARSRSSPAPGLTAAVAYRWKTPDQRERRAAGVRAASCPSTTTTRSSAGRGARARPLRRGLPRRPRRRPARPAAAIELTAGRSRAGGATVERVAPRGDSPPRAARLARAARRPRLALPRRAARGRPGERPGDRHAQAAARRLLAERQPVDAPVARTHPLSSSPAGASAASLTASLRGGRFAASARSLRITAARTTCAPR